MSCHLGVKEFSLCHLKNKPSRVLGKGKVFYSWNYETKRRQGRGRGQINHTQMDINFRRDIELSETRGCFLKV
jgi:hypothetical protein